MSIFKTTVTFRRFRVTEPLPTDFRATVTDAIQRFAHVERMDARTKDPNVGWVAVTDAADTDFEPAKVAFDPYLAASMRVDTKSIPAKLFKVLAARRLEEVRHERGLERIGKNHRTEIVEALEEELLSQALPSVAVHDVCWNLSTGDLYLFAKSDGIAEMVRVLVRDTFGLQMFPSRMVDTLARYMPREEIEERAQGYIPGGSAADGRAAAVDKHGWHELDPLHGREVLIGSEFLEWLWRESERYAGDFTLPSETDGAKPDDVTLWMDSRLVFRDTSDENPATTSLVGAVPSATPEARATMEGGKRPVEARIGFSRGDCEWFCTLKVSPAGLGISGLKVPAEVQDGDAEMIYERMFLIEVAESVIGRLFSKFYRARTSAGWGEVVAGWASGGEE